MQPYRARLASARPAAVAYAETLAGLPPDVAGLEGRVGAVIVYPVKGLGGVELPRARVERGGLVDPATGFADRSAMLTFARRGTTPEGEAFDSFSLSNRLDGTLSLARARLDDGHVVYEAPGVDPLRLAPEDLAPRKGRVRHVRLYEGGPVVEGVELDGPLAEWGRSLLRAHPRRRRFEVEGVSAVVPSIAHARAVSEKHRAGESAETLFGDGAHLLVASRATLAWMNDALRARGSRAIDMAAFRPNIVLDALPPNVEDLAGEVEIDGPDGPIPVAFATLCVRCDATRVDLATGERLDKEPLAFLASERPPRLGEPNTATFAVNAVVRATAYGRTLEAGARVRVVRERQA